MGIIANFVRVIVSLAVTNIGTRQQVATPLTIKVATLIASCAGIFPTKRRVDQAKVPPFVFLFGTAVPLSIPPLEDEPTLKGYITTALVISMARKETQNRSRDISIMGIERTIVLRIRYSAGTIKDREEHLDEMNNERALIVSIGINISSVRDFHIQTPHPVRTIIRDHQT